MTIEARSGGIHGVLCDCGKFHNFDGYYFAHTHLELKLQCECGSSCIIKNEQIIKVSRKES